MKIFYSIIHPPEWDDIGIVIDDIRYLDETPRYNWMEAGVDSSDYDEWLSDCYSAGAYGVVF